MNIPQITSEESVPVKVHITAHKKYDNILVQYVIPTEIMAVGNETKTGDFLFKIISAMADKAKVNIRECIL